MKMDNELLHNIEKIHTTELGIMRIKHNLELEIDDIVNWSKKKIQNAENFVRNGKNWYVSFDDCILTINAGSYTIITAHKRR
jgi:hypothetical protein